MHLNTRIYRYVGSGSIKNSFIKAFQNVHHRKSEVLALASRGELGVLCLLFNGRGLPLNTNTMAGAAAAI